MLGVHARRHQVIARALGRRLGQDRRLDVLESARIQMTAQRRHEMDAKPHHALHLGTAKIKVTVLELEVLVRVLVQRERQIACGVQHLDRIGEHLELAGAHPVVDADAPAHAAGDAQAILVADLARCRERLCVVRIDDDLHDTFMIAKVHEDHAAVVAARVDPATERDGPAKQGLVDETAVMSSHEIEAFAPDGAGKREMLRRKLLRCNVEPEAPVAPARKRRRPPEGGRRTFHVADGP